MAEVDDVTSSRQQLADARKEAFNHKSAIQEVECESSWTYETKMCATSRDLRFAQIPIYIQLALHLHVLCPKENSCFASEFNSVQIASFHSCIDIL